VLIYEKPATIAAICARIDWHLPTQNRLDGPRLSEVIRKFPEATISLSLTTAPSAFAGYRANAMISDTPGRRRPFSSSQPDYPPAFALPSTVKIIPTISIQFNIPGHFGTAA
jgi:hypothetical protein